MGAFVVKRLPDTAVADRRAADPAEIRRRWGVYADLAEHNRTSTVYRGFRRVTTDRWIVPGLQLEEKTAQPDAPDDAPIAIVHTLDPTTATVAYSTGPMSREIEADGSIRTDVNSGDAVIRTRIALAGPDAYDWAFGEVRSGKYKSLQKLRFEREGGGKRESGGMLGTLIGAGVGVAAPRAQPAVTRRGPTLRRVRVPASPSPTTASARSRAAAMPSCTQCVDRPSSTTRCTSGRSRRAIRKPTPIAPMPRMKTRRASRKASSAATARTETRSRDG